jgi:DNA-3-methyladenine glycosylase
MQKLGLDFYARPAIDVARDLIGAILVRRDGRKTYRARIVETEAYVGPHDLASHASKGRTARTDVMFGPPGRAYVYLIYGMHEMLNVVTSIEGDPQAVLIRAAEPLDDWDADLSGPGRLARAMNITRALNAIDLTGSTLFFTPDPGPNPRVITGVRVNIDYAGDWRHEHLRFMDAQSPAVSRPRPKTQDALPSPAALSRERSERAPGSNRKARSSPSSPALPRPSGKPLRKRRQPGH